MTIHMAEPTNGRAIPIPSPGSKPLTSYQDLLPRVVEEALAFFDDLRHRPVVVPNRDAELRELFDGPLPVGSSSPEVVLKELLLGGELGVCPTGSSRYFGYVVGGALPITVAADWLTSVWDQCGVIYGMSPLTSVLEEICGRWLVDLFRLPPATSVAFTPACTYSNILSLAAARYAVLARHGWNVAERGLQGAPRITVLANELIHASVLRALKVVGLNGNVHRVATDRSGRIRPDALATELEMSAGFPLIVCGQVGEINTGAVEDLPRLCDAVHAAGGWVHLDAAFGLWAAASDELRGTVLSGVELADSWATDAHKWLNVPYDSGIAFIADAEAHRNALAISPQYLRHADSQRHTVHWGLGMSPRSRVIPLWAALRQLGKAGVAQMVERHCALARRFASHLSREPGISVLNEVTLNQVAVRFEHPTRDADTHTEQVAQAFQNAGVAWASTSRLKNQTILRLSVINWATTDDDIYQAAQSLIDCHRSLI